MITKRVTKITRPIITITIIIIIIISSSSKPLNSRT